MNAHASHKFWSKVAPHLLVWGSLFFLPLLFVDEPPRNYTVFFTRNALPLVFSAIIFYINFYWLIPRYLFRRQWGWFLFANLLLLVAALPGLDLAAELLLPGKGRWWRGDRSLNVFRTGMSFLLSAGISVAIRMTARWFRDEQERQRLANEQLRSELNELKYKLQPHFFFNTLNNIYSLVEDAPDQARDAIHRLSKLMRYLLYETNDERMPLSREMEFLVSYIALMTIRMPAHVQVEYDFPPALGQLRVAPLLFVSLVENAFKHGVSASQPSFVRFSLRQDGEKLTFRSENTDFPKKETDRSGSGIGLQDLKKRLDLLYPGHYRLLQSKPDGMYRTELTLDL
jgi:two-component sensor histidine kinase